MSGQSQRGIKIVSAVVVVSGRHDDTEAVYRAYAEALRLPGREVEFVYVLDGEFPDVRASLRQLQCQGEPIRILQLNRAFGEAAALSAAAGYARGDVVLTLPAFFQVEPEELHRLVDALDEADMVVSRRERRTDSAWNRLQTRVFGVLVRFLTRTPFRDLGSNARGLRRRVLDEIPLYGDQHRFLPVLAVNRGFRVLEIPLSQSARERRVRVAGPGTCARRLLDLLTVFFVTKFTRRPMRFYGLVGSTTAGLGGLYMLYLVFQRLVLDVPLADRPALLLAALLVVLGVQIFSMGLIGELIIYANARDMDEFAIEAVIENGEAIEPVQSGHGAGFVAPPLRKAGGAGIG